MKFFIALALFGALFINVAIANVDLDLDLDDDDIDEDDFALLREIEEQHVHRDNLRENDVARTLAQKIVAEHMAESMNAEPRRVDPCSKIHCSAGKICQSTEDGNAECICIPKCPEELEPRRRVCTNLNETWSSDCEVHRQRCLCDVGDASCSSHKIRHIHIDYYGDCRELPPCSEEEMKDFPRRMREWLFNVMRDLADRNELPQHYIDMTHEAETNLTRRWTNAAVWKWCDLDVQHDRSVSRHELFPIRAPLLALEHCIAPFFESCDPDGDHRITLQEWGQCLELDDSELTERCDEIHRDPIENSV